MCKNDANIMVFIAFKHHLINLHFYYYYTDKMTLIILYVKIYAIILVAVYIELPESRMFQKIMLFNSFIYRSFKPKKNLLNIYNLYK